MGVIWLEGCRGGVDVWGGKRVNEGEEGSWIGERAEGGILECVGGGKVVECSVESSGATVGKGSKNNLCLLRAMLWAETKDVRLCDGRYPGGVAPYDAQRPLVCLMKGPSNG